MLLYVYHCMHDCISIEEYIILYIIICTCTYMYMCEFTCMHVCTYNVYSRGLHSCVYVL
jgi:hypothetical protein